MRKSKRTKSPVWPYLGILACLFLLSLTAPRAWDRQGRRELSGLSPSVQRAAHDVTTIPLAPAEPIELETDNALELGPRDGEFDPNTPVEPPVSSPPELPNEFIPPAPPYADEFREPAEVAHLPAEPELPSTEPAAAPEPQSSIPDIEPPASPIASSDEDPPSETNPPASEPVKEPDVVATRWPLPRALLEQLTNLVHEDGQLVWAPRAQQLVQDLCSLDEPRTAREVLSQLRTIVTVEAQVPVADPVLQAQVGRTRYALARWLDVWDSALELEEVPLAERVRPASTRELQTQLDGFDELARRSSEGDAWRAYLKLEELRAALRNDSGEEQRRQVARAILTRINSPRLSPAQREFAKQGSLAGLREQLQTWAVEPVAVRDMLAHLEQFEYSGLGSDGRIVAEDYRSLIRSRPEQSEALGRHLDTHYRNANVRVAVSEELANRIVPQPERIDAPVRDTVVNVPVRGNSSTFTQLSVKLVPDARRLRFGLEAHGTVDANTISDAGPATFRNRGQSTFLVRKLFVLGPRGLVVWPAIAEAENNFNYLVSLETDYDGVPLVGSLVRNIARSQHDEKRNLARRQTEQKVAVRALHQLDSEVDARLAEAEKKMQDGQGATLRRLGLELVPISLSTTEDRVVARVRLASPEQLGAHTPRPRAPSDSWFSLQLHQSALNNAIEQLDLEGRSFDLPELFAWISEKLGRPELAQQEDLPEDVRVTFADRDPIRLACVDDRIEVTFAMAELRHEGSRWRNFQVHTHYAPEADGLSPHFTRVDTIHLDGQSVRGKIQFKLRAIFSKVLSKNRDLRLLSDSLTGDPRFKDLQMTQFDIEDGWIALAYSPRRVSSKVARKPQ